MFLNAGDEIIREITDFIKTRKGRTPLTRKFIGENQPSLRTIKHISRQPDITALGRFHDLKKIFDDLNNEYFEERITSSINWGKQSSRRLVRKRLLGSYCGHTNTIRINPVLDRKKTPLYFIKYVVYHEMLHSTVRAVRKNGRRLVHNSEFRKRERLFKEYEKAMSWERNDR